MIGYIRKSVVLFANKPLQFVLMERKMNVGPQADRRYLRADDRQAQERQDRTNAKTQWRR